MAENIEESRLRISVETEKSKKDTDLLTDSLKRNTKAGEQASDSMKGMTKSGKDLSGMVKGLATGFAGMMILRGVTSEMKKAIRAARDKENADARLVSIAKTVTKATDEQIQGLRDLSDQLQEQTTLANDVAEAGLSQILSYGATTEQTDQLALSLANLVAANKGVNATQDDAINAANMMGKALAGQAGALTKAGIIMDEHQKKLIQQGNMTTRVNTLVGVMEQNYGGLAVGLAKTNEGLAKMEDNKIADLRAELGNRLLPAVLDIKKAWGAWYKFVLDNESGVLKAVETVSKLVQDTLTGWTWLLKGQDEYKNKMSEIAPLEAEQQRVRAKIAENEEKIAKARETGENATRIKAWTNANEKGRQKIKELSEEISKVLNIETLWGKGIDETTASTKKSTGAIIENGDELEDWEKKFLKAYNAQIQKLQEENDVAEEAERRRKGFLETTQQQYNDLWFSVDEGARKAAELQEVVELLTIAQANLGVSAEEADRIMKAYLKSTTATAKKEAKEIQKSNDAIIDSAISTGEQFASTMADQLENGKADWGSFASFVVGQIGRIITELVTMKAIQAGASAIGGASGGVTASANGNAFDNSGVIPFANGGVVTSPTLFSFGSGQTGLMGEAGAEAILPLSRKNGKLGVEASGASPVTIAPQVSVVIEGDADANSADKISQATQQVTRAVTDNILSEIQRGGKLTRAVGRRA